MTQEDVDAAEPSGIWARTTAPQSDFTTTAVGEGLVVLAVGLVLTFGLALLLT